MSNHLFLSVGLLLSGIKVLFMPAYKSTDFEVHRNWLAITSSLPLDRWYKDETSQWTLDYPPLFAWFEKVLSLVAAWFDPAMLSVNNLEYASEMTVLFQRLSVIVTDLVLFHAMSLYVKEYAKTPLKHVDWLCQPKMTLLLLVVANFGLFLVDHIHFQYNGFLFGILMLSVLRICQERYAEGSFWFATLLNLKHIYLYVAPAYGVYILRNYCFSKGKFKLLSFSPQRFLTLIVVGLSVFLLSFGPFIMKDQLFVVLARLFPFKRGLCHAYWAPNFWALYNVVDKSLVYTGVRLGLTNTSSSVNVASMTGGLVQEFNHGILPSIRPGHTLLLTVLAIAPALIHTWLYAANGRRQFIRCVVMCTFGSFMFGWHVHEKAILLVIIPLTLLITDRRQDAGLFVLLSTVGHYSLFPLIFTSAETLIKYSLFLIYTVYAFKSLGAQYCETGRWYRLPLLTVVETLYIYGLPFVEIYSQSVHYLLRLDLSLPFLPLMITSVYCSIGVTYCWLKAYWIMFAVR